MDVRDAAESLQSRLERYDWLTAVGVGSMNGRPTIYVYLKNAVKSPEIDTLKRDGWMGYPVVIDRVGAIRPATA